MELAVIQSFLMIIEQVECLFFSSRRRNTRFSRDWSSDVCSSDLVDQSSQGDCVITSALKPLESSVYEIVKAFKEGTFKGGINNFYGVEQLPDAKLLTDFHGNVPQSVKDAVAKVK